MTRKALGKGLSALLPEPEPAPVAPPPPPAPGSAEPTREVAIDRLEPNPVQPRAVMGEARLQELADSIRESGIVQPIVVRPHGGRFQIIAGERRWRAAQRAGLAKVPVAVREVPDDRLLELAIVENVQREELTPIEEAAAYQKLQDDLGLTQEQVAQKVGRDRATVANTMRLLRLPRELRDLVGDGRLSAGHGRALLALDTAEDQIALGREAARKGLSVREVEARVAHLRAPRPTVRKPVDANTRAAEEKLRAALGTRVQIARQRGGKGLLKIQFGSEAELSRLYDALVRLARGV
jgi:ParB family chromosome partitioning protein